MFEPRMDCRYPTCPYCGHEEGEDTTGANDGAFLEVTCSECGEKYHVDVHLAYDCIV
jgi:transcription elongation factor Elf1